MRWPAGQLFSSLPCSVRFLYPSPYGGGAGYHPSWVRQVCPARPQAAHVGLTGPVFGLAGVTLPYSAPKTAHGATQSRFPFFAPKTSLPLPLRGRGCISSFLGSSGLLCSSTGGSRWPNRACLWPRWCRFPTRLSKPHTGPHRAEFDFTVFS